LWVFTPFWRRVQASGDAPKPLLPPKPRIAGYTIESWRLEPTHPDWAGGLRETWKPEELPAQARLGISAN
jgi:deoxyribodipyrimidine photo-lyase